MSFCSRLEAQQCPDVVVATLDTRLFHEKQTVHVDDVSVAWHGDYFTNEPDA